MTKTKIIDNPILWMTLSLPFVLLATIFLLPTYDDWGATPGPNPDSFTWSLLLPRNSYWRPLENLYGWTIAHYQWLMPWFPHVIVIAAHYTGCLFVCCICRQLGFKQTATFMGTIFCWVSTAAIATTTACDGMSQAWVQTLGLIAMSIFLRDREQLRSNYRWLLIVAVALFVKENAMCWGVAIPVVGYCFNRINRRMLITDVCCGVGLAVLYTILHFYVPTSDAYQFNNEYVEFSLLRSLRGLALLLVFTWLPIDYTHLLYAPNRNLVFVFISVITVLPFLILLFATQWKTVFNKECIGLVTAFFIVVSPHLVTIFSLMHAYASIGMAALIVAWLINRYDGKKAILFSVFTLYTLTAIIVNAEHCKAAYDSGMMGKRLSLEAINGVKHPVKKAMLIIVDNGEKRYSNFFVIPHDTFDNGAGILWENHYQWPETIDNMIIVNSDYRSNSGLEANLIRLNGYDCIWTLNGENIKTTTLLTSTKK